MKFSAWWWQGLSDFLNKKSFKLTQKFKNVLNCLMTEGNQMEPGCLEEKCLSKDQKQRIRKLDDVTQESYMKHDQCIREATEWAEILTLGTTSDLWRSKRRCHWPRKHTRTWSKCKHDQLYHVCTDMLKPYPNSKPLLVTISGGYDSSGPEMKEFLR